ncbi:MAG TPA: type IV pilus assembly protein PilM [Oligoflexia bacterium]|nr:type IV pilus assembly protein PilM [Oligoflexia bacterium]
MFDSLLSSFLKKSDDEPFIAVDIGTSAIKILSVMPTGDRFARQGYKLVGVGVAPTPAGAVNNNAVVKPEAVGKAIRTLIDANDIKGERTTFAVPAPAVFTKRITIGYCEPKDLEKNITFEAGNYIPHTIEAVHLDYQIVKVHGTSSMDVLLVAVKNEIIDSYAAALQQADLIPAIADVDSFALENMFEISYPEERAKTVALLNIGSRYTNVSILQDGQSLFAGDVGVGGRLYTDALCEALHMTPAEAEKIKAGETPSGYDESVVAETFDRTTEHIAAELQRQIGFFWNAAATDRSIEGIYVCGGAAQIPGLVEEIGVKTGMICVAVEPFRWIEWNSQFDEDLIKEVMCSMGVSVGLAIRRFGDKKQAQARIGVNG